MVRLSTYSELFNMEFRYDTNKDKTSIDKVPVDVLTKAMGDCWLELRKRGHPDSNIQFKLGKMINDKKKTESEE